jgi:tetratricopeptide (TPR) repeat protein
VTERKGELIGAQGRFEEASELYERLYRDAPRPEWAHALGDLYTLWGDLHTAQEWKLRAYSSYLQSVTAGEVYYLHCLADLCSELSGREPEAIEWARKDFALRSNFATQGHLAWAYYRGGYLEEAVDCVAAGLASAVISGRLYLQAACIYAAVSQMQLAGHYMRLAMAVNPRPPKANIALPRMTGPRSAA